MESIRERYSTFFRHGDLGLRSLIITQLLLTVQYDFLHFTSTRPEVLMRYCNSFADAIKDLQRKTSDCDSPISIAKRMALYDLPTGSPVMSAMYGEIAKATLRLKLGCSEALFGTASGAFIRVSRPRRSLFVLCFDLESAIARLRCSQDRPTAVRQQFHRTYR